MVAERVARVKHMREPGYLYYVKSDDDGWLCIYRSEMRPKKNPPVKKEDIKEKEEEVIEEVVAQND